MAADSQYSIVVQAQDDASKTLQKVRGEVEDTGKTGSDVGKKMQVAGLAIAAVGVGLTAYSKSATDTTVQYAGSVARITRETGASTESVSRLLYAMQRMGLDTQQASTVFGIFSKKINESASASDIHTTALGKLGIAVKDAHGNTLPFNDILFSVADKFKTMPNGAEKTAEAMSLFGRSGKDMLPILNQGSAGLQELGKQADKLGLTLTAKNLASVKQYTTAQKDLKDAQQSLTIAVGNEALPMWTALAQKTNEATRAFINMPEPMHSMTIATLAFGGPIMTAIGSTTAWIGSMGQAGEAVAGLAGKIPMVGNALGSIGKFAVTAGPIAAIVLAIAAAVFILLNHFHMIQPIIDEIKHNFEGISNGLKQALRPALESIHDSLQKLGVKGGSLIPILQFLATVIKDVLVVAITLFIGVVAAAIAAVAYLAAGIIASIVWLRDQWNAAWGFMRAIFTGHMDGVTSKGANSVSLLAMIFGGVPGILLGSVIRGVTSMLGFFNGGMGSLHGTAISWQGAFRTAGMALLDTFTGGMASRVANMIGTFRGAVDKIRKMLPFSDAKEGPLSTLTLSGQRLMETLATGVEKGKSTLHSTVAEALTLPMGNASLNFNGAGGGSGMAGSGSGTTNNTQTVAIQNVNLQTAAAVTAFFDKLDQDTINLGKGLTPARGLS